MKAISCSVIRYIFIGTTLLLNAGCVTSSYMVSESCLNRSFHEKQCNSTINQSICVSKGEKTICARGQLERRGSELQVVVLDPFLYSELIVLKSANEGNVEILKQIKAFDGEQDAGVLIVDLIRKLYEIDFNLCQTGSLMRTYKGQHIYITWQKKDDNDLPLTCGLPKDLTLSVAENGKIPKSEIRLTSDQ